MNNIYASSKENKELAIEFIKNMRSVADTEIHALSLQKNGKTLVKFALPPYDTSDSKQVNSLSKSFCSTAAGFAFDEGLWSPSDRIIDVFPESVPDTISENLAKMTIGHILSMNSGHSGCCMGKIIYADDPVKAFMSIDIPFEPGTHFAYDTGATFVIAAMVEKLTGESVFDYLQRKLFVHLGKSPEKWQRIENGGYAKNAVGICEGGVGLYISVDVIELFGDFLLNKGVVNGKRLLSEKWIDMATSTVSDNHDNGAIYWSSGYGYQFWMNDDGGYRGDGAFGQLCVVYPETKTVVSVICKCDNMETEVRYVLDFAKKVVENEDEEGGFFSCEESENAYKPVQTSKNGSFGGIGKVYKLSDNMQNFNTVYFNKTENGIEVNLSDSERANIISAGYGEFELSNIFARAFKPTLSGLIPFRYEDVSMYTSIQSESENELVLFVRFKNCVHKGTITFTVDGDKLSMTLNFDCEIYANVNTELCNLHGVEA